MSLHRALNRYDRIAPFYDSLANVVFGKSIRRAQTKFLGRIPSGARVLILGGGTGWLLEDLFDEQSDLAVCYVETSSAMINRAKKRKLPSNASVEFIHGTLDDVCCEKRFDVVIMNFFLDQFDDKEVDDILTKLDGYLEEGAFAYVTDFVNDGKFWKTSILRVMYFFFNVIGALSISSLVDWNRKMQERSYRAEIDHFFYQHFIRCVVYYRHKKGLFSV
jgi:tRNA (cmo5U34)-methyltransferase